MKTKLLQVPGYVTVEQAAKIIGCTSAWVRRMLASGDLEGGRISQCRIFVLRASAEDYARKPKKTGRPRISERV